MSSHDRLVTLEQIRDFAAEVEALVAGHTREQLDDSLELRRAIERCVELIGEAASRLTAEVHNAHPEIPWRQIIGMRNHLVHGYDVVSSEVLWDTACRNVPDLKLKIEAILNKPSVE